MRRRCPRLVLVAAVILVAFAYPMLAPTVHRIDHAHFEQIATGMTRAQVEAILGAPPGKYDWAEQEATFFLWNMPVTTNDVIRVPTSIELAPFRADGGQMGWIPASSTWISRHGAFDVVFDSNHRVVGKWSNGSMIVPPWDRWLKTLGIR